jgi:hypothetical protein
MTERTALGEAILRHWREHRPQMVSDLEKRHGLEEAILTAQEQTSDLLYELVSVKKMDYHAAWEMATREWAFLPEARTPKGRKPGTGKQKGVYGKRRSSSRSRQRLRHGISE